MYSFFIVFILILSSLSFFYFYKTEKRSDSKYFIENVDYDWIKLKKNFINTEWQDLPEIIIEEEKELPNFWDDLEKNEIKNDSNEELPSQINLKVPFFPQAPDLDWTLPWKEACEEASLSLAYHFVNWDNLSKEDFKNDLTEMFDMQEKLFWKYIDTNIEETSILLKEYYWYNNFEIIKNPTINHLKRELSKWHPIIAPFAWKKLWNSYYTNWWPRYHMLVIIWYNDDEKLFITNDVWTSRWQKFPYEYDIIMNSMHDLVPEWEWDILDWEKVVLVIK